MTPLAGAGPAPNHQVHARQHSTWPLSPVRCGVAKGREPQRRDRLEAEFHSPPAPMVDSGRVAGHYTAPPLPLLSFLEGPGCWESGGDVPLLLPPHCGPCFTLSFSQCLDLDHRVDTG